MSPDRAPFAPDPNPQPPPHFASPPGSNDHIPDPLPSNPMPLFKAWFDDAHARSGLPNPNAMSLATIDPDGRPATRIVLCKSVETDLAAVVFHTNYHGRKGRALEANPRAAACFHWDSLDRQARLEGLVTRISESESDAYFLTRPWISKVGAWASDQSEPIAERRELITRVESVMRRFGIEPAHPPPNRAQITHTRPPPRGGLRLWIDRVELWDGIVGRLHDRACWSRELPVIETLKAGHRASNIASLAWRATRLQP